jgi:predicted metalloprotease with PDZ domain
MGFRRVHPSVLALAAVACSLNAQSPPTEVSYRVHYERAGDEAVSIELEWPDPLGQAGSLVFPRAIPMGYGEQHYDAFVSDLRAFGPDGQSTAPGREEGPRWRLNAGTRRVTYRVNLRQMEQDVHAASDASRVREGYLGALGYSIFAYVDGYESRGTRVRVSGPETWPVFSTLSPRLPMGAAPVDARAADFYALADSQIVMGPRAVVRRLTDSPVPLYLAAYAEGPLDLDRLGRVAARAFRLVNDYFGTTPFPHYTVHYELLTPISSRHAYGMSMEHLESSTYYLAASSGLTADAPPADEGRVLSLIGHHMAHAWIPKRAYGEGYYPFQWELAPIIDSIWFAEGFGQYAAIMALAQGMPDPQTYRQRTLELRFRANITSAPPFLKRLSLIELSRVASTRYAEDFRTGRLVFSRGGLMAAAIDERIQAESKGTTSLRDALRYLVAWSARERRGFRIDELAGLIQQATNVDTRTVIEEWLRPLP